jgi:hypothetical protein
MHCFINLWREFQKQKICFSYLENAFQSNLVHTPVCAQKSTTNWSSLLIYTFYSNLNPSTSIWSFKRRTRETVWWIITMIIISYWKSKKISIIACYGGVSYFFVEWLHHIIIDWSTNFDHYFLFFLHPMILYVLIFSNDHRKKKNFFFL